MNFPVTYDALQPYLLAKGKERACYRNPVNTNTVIKLREGLSKYRFL